MRIALLPINLTKWARNWLRALKKSFGLKG
jgi:hypothetical protein